MSKESHQPERLDISVERLHDRVRMSSSSGRFRNNLRALRAARWPYTQEQLEAQARIGYDRYMRIENGVCGPQSKELERIVAALNRRGKQLGLPPITAADTGCVVDETSARKGRPPKSASSPAVGKRRPIKAGPREHRSVLARAS